MFNASQSIYVLRAVLFVALLMQQYRCIVYSYIPHSEQHSTRYSYPNQESYVQNNPNVYQQQQESTRNMHINNNNRMPPAGTHSYQHNQQQSAQLNHQQNMRTGLTQTKASNWDRLKNKCRIWVPNESVDKYPYASRIQIDQSKQLQEIEICCAGFGPVRWMGSTHCRPLCENCLNGKCLSPGICQCYDEFVSNDNGDCVFTCPLGCLNGRCYLDGSCQCDAGYKLDETRRFCRPICSSGCGLNPRHNCTEPEVCGCAKGYQLTDEGCQPTCQPECGVGGYCREYNVCQCTTGYNLKNGVCQSDCYQKCDNGICYGRNRCICNAGFAYHERSMKCIPV